MAESNVLAVKLDMLHSDVVDMKTALGELSKAITKLALVEERQSQTAEALERAFKSIGKIEDRLSALEQAAPKSKDPRTGFASKATPGKAKSGIPAGAKPFTGSYNNKTHKLQNINGKTYVVKR